MCPEGGPEGGHGVIVECGSVARGCKRRGEFFISYLYLLGVGN